MDETTAPCAPSDSELASFIANVALLAHPCDPEAAERFALGLVDAILMPEPARV
jgi:hypothetical protein